jgi:hypothetical protein
MADKWYGLLAVLDLCALLVVLYFGLLPDWISLLLAGWLGCSVLQFLWPDLGAMWRDLRDAFR